MVELDIRLSRDGVPIVVHDRTLKRISGRRGAIGGLSARHLTSLDLGQSRHLSTLAEVLSELTPQIPINVELKFSQPELRPMATAVCRVIADLGVTSRVLVSSFYHQSLLIAQKLLPELSVAPLFGCLTGPPHEDDLEPVFARPRRHDAPSIYPFQGPAAVVWNKMIDKELAHRFQCEGATLLTYTVDEPEEMKRLIDLGIDGIITNRPAVLEGVLTELFGCQRAS
jgi:glycerophosphoryl diester phosphodiesterase